ncbi:hypothetical protein WMF37_46100 [Sorangium sp. So ce291]|uniref:hypothetical protein n=1 Tax=Sorangium sp. So ce291 TaxID=3133294 RepID=UPI003F63845B
MPAASLALALRAARTAASAAACALLALPAAAADAPRAAREPLLVLAASPSADHTDRRAVDLVAAHVRPLGVRLQIVRPGAPRPALQDLLPEARALAEAWDARGVLWIDAGSKGELALYVVERDGDQVYGRRIPVPPGQTATALESLANIAGAVAEELREGHVAGMTRVDVAAAAPDAAALAPEAVPAPAAPPVAPPRPRAPAGLQQGARREPGRLPTLALLAGYTGANFSGEAPWQSAAALRASWAPVDSAVFGLGYELVPSTSVGDERFAFDLVRHPVSTSGQLRFHLPLGLDLQIGARASVDVVQRVPQSGTQASDPPAQEPLRAPLPRPPRGFPPPPPWMWPRMAPQQLPPPEPQTDLLFSVAPVAELGYPLTPWLRLKALVGVDFLLTRPDASAHPALAIQPDPVRILAGMGLELGVALPSPPAAAGAGGR